MEKGVPLEDVQYLAGHAALRTTRLYDRRKRRVIRNIVERVPAEAANAFSGHRSRRCSSLGYARTH